MVCVNFPGRFTSVRALCQCYVSGVPFSNVGKLVNRLSVCRLVVVRSRYCVCFVIIALKLFSAMHVARARADNADLVKDLLFSCHRQKYETRPVPLHELLFE